MHLLGKGLVAALGGRSLGQLRLSRGEELRGLGRQSVRMLAASVLAYRGLLELIVLLVLLIVLARLQLLQSLLEIEELGRGRALLVRELLVGRALTLVLRDEAGLGLQRGLRS